MTCKHNDLMGVNAVLIGKVCQVCLQAKLEQAIKVIKAADQFKIGVERILDPSDEEYTEISKELTAAIANFKAIPQSGQGVPR